MVKQSAVAPEMMQHRGPARVFTVNAAVEAILSGQIKPGMVVIRYEVPRVVPACGKCCHPPRRWLVWALIRKWPSLPTVASPERPGSIYRTCFPEAAEGGPIALVEGGEIIIDIPNRSLQLTCPMRSDREKETLASTSSKVKEGYLKRYAKLVTSAATGAVFAD